MELPELRRAFRARPETLPFYAFATFLDGLEANESEWGSLVSVLELEVVPVVARYHRTMESDEIASICYGGAFERWTTDWLDRAHLISRTRDLLAEQRSEEALDELTRHARFRAHRADRARALWVDRRAPEAIRLIEGTQSARSHFITKTRAQIQESLRKRDRQNRLLTRHCSAALGLPSIGGSLAVVTEAARSACGAELDHSSGEHSRWLISVLPPAHVAGQDLAVGLRRIFAAIRERGPEHERVFELLLEGHSQRRIAELEGRHPAAISRRVRVLEDICRTQLLD